MRYCDYCKWFTFQPFAVYVSIYAAGTTSVEVTDFLLNCGSSALKENARGIFGFKKIVATFILYVSIYLSKDVEEMLELLDYSNSKNKMNEICVIYSKKLENVRGSISADKEIEQTFFIKIMIM
ncbi:MAG TPA: hypothetical protein VHO70_04230 [Chitinispirillaceae bacterium]|nr:hypothetical protein [Chitinispirillaceae bacterium]